MILIQKLLLIAKKIRKVHTGDLRPHEVFMSSFDSQYIRRSREEDFQSANIDATTTLKSRGLPSLIAKKIKKSHTGDLRPGKVSLSPVGFLTC